MRLYVCHITRGGAHPGVGQAARGTSGGALSLIQRAYKTELDLNNEQIAACKRHAGAARWAYNWGLARKQEAYHATGKSPSAMDLHRDLNALKQDEVSWLYSVSKCAPRARRRKPCAT